MSLTLLSDRIHFNVTAIDNQYSNFKVQYEDGEPAIYLTGTISEPDNYRDLIMYINSLDVPKAKLYLAGHGGRVESTLQLINTIRHSKTDFTAVVYGDVYSAHAMLAVSMPHLIVKDDNIVFLFHLPAYEVNKTHLLGSQVCEGVTGTDRGVSAKDKCISFMKATGNEFIKTVVPHINSFLTPNQFNDFMSGDDIVLSYKEMLNNKKVN